MAAHTQQQRAFIVAALAAYGSPDEIAAEFRNAFKDTDCTPDDVRACVRERLDAGWQAFFDRERAAFLAAPTNDHRVRLAELHRLFVKARDRNAIDLAAKLLAQIHEMTGSKGGMPGEGAPGEGGPIRAIELIVVDPKPIAEPTA